MSILCTYTHKRILTSYHTYLTKKRFAYLKTWFNIPTVIFREKMALTALRVFLWRFVLFTHNHITKTSTHPYTHVHDCFHSRFPKEARCSNPRVPHYPRIFYLRHICRGQWNASWLWTPCSRCNPDHRHVRVHTHHYDGFIFRFTLIKYKALRWKGLLSSVLHNIIL